VEGRAWEWHPATPLLLGHLGIQPEFSLDRHRYVCDPKPRITRVFTCTRSWHVLYSSQSARSRPVS
jgi:hypothetical protein